MAASTATIASNTIGDPEVGEEVIIRRRGTTTRRRRALIGWNHQDDSPHGLNHGKIWCWVSAGNHLQIYDATFNRSPKPGEVVFCGVANFTMVRMFHPFWCSYGTIPRDMVSQDKKRCRENYNRLMRRWQEQHGNRSAGKDDSEDSDAPDDPSDANAGNIRSKLPRRGRSRGRSRGRGRGRGGRGGIVFRRAPRQAVTGIEVNVPGSAADNSMNISDTEDKFNFNSNYDSDCDADSDAISDSDDESQRLQRKRVALPPAANGESLIDGQEGLLNFDVDNITAKQENTDKIKIEKEVDVIEVIDLTSDNGEDDAVMFDVDSYSDIDIAASFTPNVATDTATDAGIASSIDEARVTTNSEDSEMFVDRSIAEDLDLTEVDNGHEMRFKTEEEKQEEARAYEESQKVAIAIVRRMLGPREVVVIDDD